jgi:hypothetical protein
MGADLLAPFREEFDSRRVVARVERARDGEPDGGAGLAHEALDGGVIDQRLTRPTLADRGIAPRLERIPLGDARGIILLRSRRSR